MRIRAFATLRDVLGTNEVKIEMAENTAVRQVLRELVARYPALGKKLWDNTEKPTGQITILLNGRSLEYLKGLDSEVSNTDTLSLFPPVGGG